MFCPMEMPFRICCSMEPCVVGFLQFGSCFGKWAVENFGSTLSLFRFLPEIAENMPFHPVIMSISEQICEG